MTDGELDAAIERYHAAAGEFIRGNPEPQKAVFSRGDDVSLVNPAGVVARGWADAAQAIERASAQFADGSDGEVVGFERLAQQVTPELAYIMEIERFRVNACGCGELADMELRVTSILRPEDGIWKVVHRHADPITTTGPPSSALRGLASS